MDNDNNNYPNHNYHYFHQIIGNVSLSQGYWQPVPIRGTSMEDVITVTTLTIGNTTVTMNQAEWNAFYNLLTALGGHRLDNAIIQVQSELFGEDDEFENNEEDN